MELIIKQTLKVDIIYRRTRHLLVLTILLAIESALATGASGQTFAEIFKQKKTQKKYLLQQIAALQVYIGYARQGYEIADQGISTIKGLTGGELNLHSAFFASQKAISPLISKHPHVMQIISMQLSISNSLKNVEKSEIAGSENRIYIKKVAEHILEECSRDLEDLFLLLTSGSLEMKDDQRLKHLDRVAASMLEKADFVQRFSSEVALLSAQQAAEQKSINHQKKLYEIDQ